MPRQKHKEALHGLFGGMFRGMLEVRLVYLFGSQVYGDPGPSSDYDFGISFDRVQPTSEVRASIAHQLSRALETERVDVVLLNRAPIELAYVNIAYGELIYESNAAIRVNYEAYVMGLCGDYLPVLRTQRRDILKGGANATRVQRYRTAFGRTERTLDQIRAAQRESQG